MTRTSAGSVRLSWSERVIPRASHFFQTVSPRRSDATVNQSLMSWAEISSTCGMRRGRGICSCSSIKHSHSSIQCLNSWMVVRSSGSSAIRRTTGPSGTRNSIECPACMCSRDMSTSSSLLGRMPANLSKATAKVTLPAPGFIRMIIDASPRVSVPLHDMPCDPSMPLEVGSISISNLGPRIPSSSKVDNSYNCGVLPVNGKREICIDAVSGKSNNDDICCDCKSAAIPSKGMP